jgi:hypothetical protein
MQLLLGAETDGGAGGLMGFGEPAELLRHGGVFLANRVEEKDRQL